MQQALTTTTGAAIIQAQPFSVSLIDSFIAWVDRPGKTTQTYITNLRQFFAFLRYRQIAAPTRPDIIQYRDWLSSEHEAIAFDSVSAIGWHFRTDSHGLPLRISCKPATIAGYLRAVCAFFKWTASENLYPDIAANVHPPKLRHDTHHKEALTLEEAQRIEQSIARRAEQGIEAAASARKDTQGRTQRSSEQGKRMAAIYALCESAGLRCIEVSRAKIRDFETRNGQAYLYIFGKGRSEADQCKPIAPEVAQLIRDYLQARTDHPTANSPLFCSTGNRSGGQAIAPETISRMIKAEMRAAGFDSERITAHSLRHTAGTQVMEMTGDLYTAQKYMRHSSPTTTELYLHTDTQRTEAAIANRLYKRLHGVEAESSRDQLAQLLEGMTPQQLERITAIAEAMRA